MSTQFWIGLGIFAAIYIAFVLKGFYDGAIAKLKITPEEIEGLIDEFINRLDAKGASMFLYPLRIELTINQADKYKAMAAAGKSRIAIYNTMTKDGQAYANSVKERLHKAL
jgi:hypothetical protein